MLQRQEHSLPFTGGPHLFAPPPPRPRSCHMQRYQVPIYGPPGSVPQSGMVVVPMAGMQTGYPVAPPAYQYQPGPSQPQQYMGQAGSPVQQQWQGQPSNPAAGYPTAAQEYDLYEAQRSAQVAHPPVYQQPPMPAQQAGTPPASYPPMGAPAPAKQM